MYKNNSLNLFVNTESDNLSSEFDLLKKLQKETKQNNDTSLSPTSTDMSKLKNNISLSSTSDENNINTNTQSYLPNVLQKNINTKTNSTTSELNTSEQNNNVYSITSSEAKDASPFIKSNTKQKKHEYLIQEPYDFNNETSEYKPPSINYDNMIKSLNNNNNNNNNSNNDNNNNSNKERTVNLTSIFGNVIGLFTYLFTLDNSKSNDDDSDII